MSWWTIEPRDPLMIRDGRPFGLDTEGARSLGFPTPSAIAGTLRSRIGVAVGNGRFALTPEEALQIKVMGPLLIEIEPNLRLWLPAPRDCVLFEEEDVQRQKEGWPRFRLTPGERWIEGCSLLETLRPLVPVRDLPPGKPARDAPAFWDSRAFLGWSSLPPSADRLPRAYGRPPLPHETRVHVAIDPETGTGLDGKLFQTDGLRLCERRDGAYRRMVFAIGCADARLEAGLVTLGGERRLSSLLPAPEPLVSLLAGWKAPELRGSRARVTLLTPALFREGAVPSTIAGSRVVAAAVGRPQPISGWDMTWTNSKGARGGPKPSRRSAPAGSVYWVELEAGRDPSDWAARVHLESVSDEEQDRRDGFGLAAVGVWE